MASTSETGHVKNVANFLKYNQFVATLGTTYNPSEPSLVLASLTTMQAAAKTKLDTVSTALDAWKDATNKREIAFNPLATFSRQLLGLLKSTSATQQAVDDFTYLVGKMRGDAEGKLTKADAGKVSNPEINSTSEEETQSKSTSQQSFDQKLEHFGKMILLLQSVPSYTPNEVNMQVATLQAQLATLQAQLATLTALNAIATNATATLKSSRIDRNTFYYTADTGMLDIIKKSKAYIQGVYGASSQQYKTAISYKFVRVIPKNKAK